MGDTVNKLSRHRYTPILVFLCGLILSVLVWHEVNLLQDGSIRELLRQKEVSVVHHIKSAMDDRILALERMAGRWESHGGVDRAYWEADARNYIADQPGYQAIEYADVNSVVRWIVPLRGNEVARNLKLADEANRKEALRLTRLTGNTHFTKPIDLVQSGKGFLTFSPLYSKGSFDGYLVGVFRFKELLESLIDPIDAMNFHISIHTNDQLVFTHALEDANPSYETVYNHELYGVIWTFTVMPTNALVAEFRTDLPTYLLILLLLLTLTFSFLAYKVRAELLSRAQLEDTQEELARTNERFSLAIDGSSDGLWDWDIESGQVHYSKRFKALLGYEDKEFPNLFETWEQTLHPGDREDVLAKVRAHLDGKAPYDVEYRCMNKNGEYRWYRARGQAIWNAENQPVRMAGSITCISEQKWAEQQITFAQQRLELALKAANEGLWDWNLNDNSTYFNDSWYTMLGYEPEELPMSLDTWKNLAHPDDLPTALKAVERYFDGEISIYRSEHRLKAKDGEWNWILDVGEIVERNEDGSPKRMVGVHIDIHQQKINEIELAKAKDLALQASKTKGEFLANMSHEIRTPMNGILGMTGLLLDTDLDSDQRDIAETVKLSADSLLVIINDILDFSKIEAGKLELSPIMFSLSDFLIQLEKLHKSRIEKKNIAFFAELAEGVPKVVIGDPDRLQQILINLIGNALKFTPEGGAIILRVDKEGDVDGKAQLQFSVYDTGIGIPKEKQSRIFDAFSQADSSTTREYGGTGLGLPISSKLVRMMGGEISLSSEPGQGTVFYFTALFEESTEEKLAQNAEAELLSVGTDFENLNILLAEDNPVNQKLATRILEKVGHKVTVANNGQEAVDLSSTDAFDVILMDMQIRSRWGYFIRATASKPGIASPISLKAGFRAPSDCISVSGRMYSSWDRIGRPLRSVTVMTDLSKRPASQAALARLWLSTASWSVSSRLNPYSVAMISAEIPWGTKYFSIATEGSTATAAPSEPIGTRPIISTPPAI